MTFYALVVTYLLIGLLMVALISEQRWVLMKRVLLWPKELYDMAVELSRKL